MSKKRFWNNAFILLGMMLLSWSALGQKSVTKSGTTVTPPDHIPIPLSSMTKSGIPLPFPTNGTYLVVTTPDLQQALSPLLQWKRQQGWHVETLSVERVSNDSIRALLKQRYLSSSPLRPAQQYVLIVGDVDRIPAFWGSYAPAGLSNHVTDLYYGEYSGDYLPEAWVGRLAVSDCAELATVTDKIVGYEQGRWADPGSILLVAGKEERSPAPTTTNGQVDYLARNAKENLATIDTLCFRNPSSDSLTDSLATALGEDNILVNYTGHCMRQGWEHPTMRGDALPTEASPTLFVNNCCLSNAFNGNCFGEELLKMPNGGAVGVIGATNETLWAEDYYWAVGAQYPFTLHPSTRPPHPGAFDPLFSTEGTSIGALMYAGCCAVTLAGSPFDAFYWETYCLLGDPSMTLFLKPADTLTLSVEEPLRKGCRVLTATTNPYSRVSVTEDTLLLGTATADSNGKAVIPLVSAIRDDSVTLTATRHDAIATSMTLPTATPARCWWSIADSKISEGRLQLELQNVGLSISTEHSAKIYQTDEDRSNGAAMTADILTETIETPLLTSAIGYMGGAAPVLYLHADFVDDSGHTYSSESFAIEVQPGIEIVRIALLDRKGVPATEVLPGRDYTIAVTLSDSGGMVRTEVNQHEAIEDSIRQEAKGETHYLSFPVEEEHIEITCMAEKEGWHDTLQGWMLPYKAHEGFEANNWENYPWQHGNIYPWQLDGQTTHSGQTSARSATIDNAQQSSLELDITVLTEDSITFFHKESCEGSDWLTFYVDGRRNGYWSGENDWRRHGSKLSTGHHRLQWVYKKDASNQRGEDCVWIDDVTLPLCLFDRPCGVIEPHDTVGIAEAEEEIQTLKVYPNPSDGKANIALSACPHSRTLDIYDQQGRCVEKIIIPPICHPTQYSTPYLRFGIYTLVLHNETSIQITKMIVTK